MTSHVIDPRRGRCDHSFTPRRCGP